MKINIILLALITCFIHSCKSYTDKGNTSGIQDILSDVVTAKNINFCTQQNHEKWNPVSNDAKKYLIKMLSKAELFELKSEKGERIQYPTYKYHIKVSNKNKSFMLSICSGIDLIDYENNYYKVNLSKKEKEHFSKLLRDANKQ